MLSSQDAAVIQPLLSSNQGCWAARPLCCCSPTKATETYPIILPLSLVRRFVGKLNHPGPGAELKELESPKGLGEQVRKLVLGVDVARLDTPFLQIASDEVVPHPDVLAAFMEDGVLCRARADLLSTLSSTALVSLPRRSPSSRASQSA